jgi:hypothetical protein
VKPAVHQPSNFDRSFNRRITIAGVPKITRHNTRKTCGSLLAALDVHLRVVMQILWHSKIAITMEIYTEVPSASTREARSGSSGSGLVMLRMPDWCLTGDCCINAAPRPAGAGFMVTTGS